MTVVFFGMGEFVIYFKDRFRRKVSTPRSTSPMIFQLEKQVVPFNNFDVLPSPLVHNQINFASSYEKNLTSKDYDGGYVSKNFHY